MSRRDSYALFIRVENDSENDGQLAIESAVLDRVRAAGVLTYFGDVLGFMEQSHPPRALAPFEK